jgi:hypothetical protein
MAHMESSSKGRPRSHGWMQPQSAQKPGAKNWVPSQFQHERRPTTTFVSEARLWRAGGSGRLVAGAAVAQLRTASTVRSAQRACIDRRMRAGTCWARTAVTNARLGGVSGSVMDVNAPIGAARCLHGAMIDRGQCSLSADDGIARLMSEQTSE